MARHRLQYRKRIIAIESSYFLCSSVATFSPSATTTAGSESAAAAARSKSAEATAAADLVAKRVGVAGCSERASHRVEIPRASSVRRRRRRRDQRPSRRCDQQRADDAWTTLRGANTAPSYQHRHDRRHRSTVRDPCDERHSVAMSTTLRRSPSKILFEESGVHIAEGRGGAATTAPGAGTNPAFERATGRSFSTRSRTARDVSIANAEATSREQRRDGILRPRRGRYGGRGNGREKEAAATAARASLRARGAVGGRKEESGLRLRNPCGEENSGGGGNEFDAIVRTVR